MKKLHRFIITQSLPSAGGIFEIADRSLAHQIMRVLKLVPGEAIVLCDGQGSEAPGKILDGTTSSVRIELEPIRVVISEPELRVHLYAALIRPELFELIVQKTTELGVASITPLITERTIRAGFKRTRLESIAKEAAELSGRGIVPAIHEPRALTDALVSSGPSRWFVADQGGGRFPAEMPRLQDVALCIGPEGGWTDRERALFKERGIQAVDLGITVLRAETAAIVGCFAALNAVR